MSVRLVSFLLVLGLVSSAGAQSGDPGTVLERVVLDDLVFPFERTLGQGDAFGGGVAALGDLNGDGLNELAVGAPGDDLSRGAVWIFSLTPARTVAKFVKLGPDENLPFHILNADRFGSAIASPGDIDGDGLRDLAVGAPGVQESAVYLLGMSAIGQIRYHARFDRFSPALAGHIGAGSDLGTSLAALGDLDGNGVPDLAVGAPGEGNGAVLILFLAADRSIVSVKKLTGINYGLGLAALGDLDGDGKEDLAVARFTNFDVLFLDTDGDVLSRRTNPVACETMSRVGDVDGNGTTDIAVGESVRILLLNSDGSVLGTSAVPGSGGGFGSSLAGPGDTDGDGLLEVVVGAPNSDARINNSGAIHFFDLSASGAPVGGAQIVNAATSGVPIAPNITPNFDNYGQSIAPLGDLNGDGHPEVAVGAPLDDDGATDAGAVWIHFMRDGLDGTRVNKMSATQESLPLAAGVGFGSSLAFLGDLDGDGTGDLAVGAPNGLGSIWILFLKVNGELESSHVLTRPDVIGAGPGLGVSLTCLGDLDGDGIPDLAVNDFGGRIFVLFLAADGSIRSQHQLGAYNGRFLAWMGRAAESGRRFLGLAGGGVFQRIELDSNGQPLASSSIAGSFNGLASTGDLDGNGVGDIVSLEANKLVFRFLTASGAVLATRAPKIGFGGLCVAGLGDLTGDGIPDLAGGFVPLGSTLSSRVLLMQMGGIATAGFEHRDSADERPLENGRQIPRPHPGRAMVISSGGANLGATVFDSTPLGPNDPSQDRDLLVDSGMVLMLQNSQVPSQSTPGIFDQPNDDQDGGFIDFDFPREIRALSIEMCDIDPGAQQAASVTLIDAQGRTRVYDLPPGFTEDRVANGGSGLRTLDLTTLAPQPGYVATATAAQHSAFDAARVVRIEIELGSSGAVDDLIYDPYP